MQIFNTVIVPAVVTGVVVCNGCHRIQYPRAYDSYFELRDGDLIMRAPMGTLVATNIWGISEWPAIVIGMAICIVMGLVIERFCMRPFLGRPAQYGWILTTLGASTVVEQFAVQPFKSPTTVLSVRRLPSALPYKLDSGLSPQEILLVGSAVGVVIVLLVLYRTTRLGRMLIAVGEDSDGARALGISAGRMSQVAMVLAALSAAVAGFVVAPTLLVDPTFGFSLTFSGFVAAAIGGLGSIGGGIVGGMAIGLMGQLTAVYVGAIWTDAVVFGSLLALYLIRPWGLFGRRPVRTV